MRRAFGFRLASAPALAAAGRLALCLALGTTAARAGTLLEAFGLQARNVGSLSLQGSLYAGTLGDGVFRRDLTSPSADWVNLGLTAKLIRAVHPQPENVTTIGLEGAPPFPDSALVYQSFLDQPPWVEADGGIVRANVLAIWSIDGLPSAPNGVTLFATSIGSTGGVWRRRPNAAWESVLDIGAGVGNVVRVDPATGAVWAGGENAIFAPWIARSTDGGDHWHVATPDLAGDNACDVLALHPHDPMRAYAGMEGAVYETRDGGVTWVATGLAGTQAYIYGVALDTATPRHILAGGMVANPNTWALWESFDSGASWTSIPPPFVTPRVTTGITALVADPVRPNTFYIGTRGDGVWRYQSAPTSSDPPSAFPTLRLHNHPNPFNGTTTLRFEIPPAPRDAHVRLAIFDARGALLQELVNERRPTGTYESTWNAMDRRGRRLGSGVYYARLEAGRVWLARRVVLVE